MLVFLMKLPGVRVEPGVPNAGLTVAEDNLVAFKSDAAAATSAAACCCLY